MVYKAQDTKLDRIVGLKFLPQHLNASEQEQASGRSTSLVDRLDRSGKPVTESAQREMIRTEILKTILDLQEQELA